MKSKLRALVKLTKSPKTTVQNPDDSLVVERSRPLSVGLLSFVAGSHPYVEFVRRSRILETPSVPTNLPLVAPTDPCRQFFCFPSAGRLMYDITSTSKAHSICPPHSIVVYPINRYQFSHGPLLYCNGIIFVFV